MGIQAIPTKYKGIQFRSRLEATWAAFFDGIGWPYQYEPIALAGYIPDFVIPFPKAPLLVEVKPVFTIAELGQYTDKIEASGWTREAMVVGTEPLSAEDVDPIMGLVSQREKYEAGWDAAVMHRCAACKRISIHHYSGLWDCYACGAYDGDGLLCPLDMGEIMDRWNEAKNLVQWRKAGD